MRCTSLNSYFVLAREHASVVYHGFRIEKIL